MKKNNIFSGKFFTRIQSKKFPAQTTFKNGFVSIFAIFFSAIVVSVLTAIYVLLIKQIEILNFDYYSFQSLYAADSAFECMVYKEQTATGTKSVLLPANSGTLGSCGIPGDLSWISVPTIGTGATVGRSVSQAKFYLNTDQGDFCTVINANVETRDFSQSATPPAPNTMNFSGQSKNCDTSETKVVERLIEFYF
jgi:hypothetical protein